MECGQNGMSRGQMSISPRPLAATLNMFDVTSHGVLSRWTNRFPILGDNQILYFALTGWLCR